MFSGVSKFGDKCRLPRWRMALLISSFNQRFYWYLLIFLITSFAVTVLRINEPHNEPRNDSAPDGYTVLYSYRVPDAKTAGGEIALISRESHPIGLVEKFTSFEVLAVQTKTVRTGSLNIFTIYWPPRQRDSSTSSEVFSTRSYPWREASRHAPAWICVGPGESPPNTCHGWLQPAPARQRTDTSTRASWTS